MENTTKIQANGTFEVKLTPQPAEENVGDPSIARMAIDKRFAGSLEATSKGQMISAGTAVEGSAVYSALERVTGTLNGRQGSFSLQHTGIMDRGMPSLIITVVPDSGTDQLVGLRGTMQIDIVEGKHFYRFDYTLPEGN